MARLQRVARQYRALPHIFEELLRDDAVFVPSQRRHVENDNRPVKGQLGYERCFFAKCFVQPAAVEAIEHGRKRYRYVTARLGIELRELVAPIASYLLEVCLAY